MNPLALPVERARDVFDACVIRVRDLALRQRLIDVAESIETADLAYRATGATNNLHAFPQSTVLGPGVTVTEMAWVYRERLVRKNTTRRSIYDKLLMAAPFGICPLCAQRTVATLDHYLPLSQYAALAVAPANLIPACLDCNKEKLDRVPMSQADLTLHPYFDNYSEETWLAASVNEIDPASLLFSVRPPEHWGDVARLRIENHFAVFKLGALYGANAAVELSNIRHNMRRLFNAGGERIVLEHLSFEAESREQSQRNSWQTAMYRALSSNRWYCGGGFG